MTSFFAAEDRRLRLLGWMLVLVVILAGCPAGENRVEPEEPAGETAEEFLESFRAALRRDDRPALLALVHWEGVGEQMRESQEKTLDRLLRQEVESVVLSPRPENYRAGGVRNGIRYRPNLEIDGMFEVTFGAASAGAVKSLSLPYGRVDGRYFIAGIVEEPTSYDGPADRSISISVIGAGAASPVAFEGVCSYRVSGEEKQQELIGEGNLNRAFWGQSVSGCTLRRTSEGGWLELRISVDGQQVYESGRVDSAEPIEYRADAG